jgi:hypothetical protein
MALLLTVACYIHIMEANCTAIAYFHCTHQTFLNVYSRVPSSVDIFYFEVFVVIMLNRNWFSERN